LTAHKCTSAQLPADLKNKISHRAQALNLLMEKLTILFN
jgi:inosine/xanthosine triphosphate pyrophosphatase family protein